jgi:CYTH domain-containing protein
MGLEIERRFLVRDSSVLEGASREIIVQGYFFVKNGYAARVRRLHHVESDGSHRESQATLTVKGPRRGAERAEFEMEIDGEFAMSMLKIIEHKISKSRYHIVAVGELWDVDVYHGDNEGLIIAECEMEEHHRITVPTWCAEEITENPDYNNENLARRPYRTWRVAG